MKEKLPLIVGIALPILLVVFVVATSYIPSILVKPRYNFIYAQRNYDYETRVVDGKITSTPKYQNNYYGTPYYTYQNPAPPVFYLYDVTTNTSKTISLQVAQTYKLDSSSKSPDGFTIGQNDSSYSSFFPFYSSSSSRGMFLQGKGLNRQVTTDEYNFQFLGWII